MPTTAPEANLLSSFKSSKNSVSLKYSKSFNFSVFELISLGKSNFNFDDFSKFLFASFSTFSMISTFGSGSYPPPTSNTAYSDFLFKKKVSKTKPTSKTRYTGTNIKESIKLMKSKILWTIKAFQYIASAIITSISKERRIPTIF